MANPSWFNEAYYLNSKLAQLQASGETQYTNVGQVYAAIVAADQTPYQNYTQYSLVELTDPNQYFDTTEYLEAKAVEMGLPQTDWSYVSVALQQAGFTNAYAHYHQFGWLEGVNPNNDFDTDTYIQDLADLNGITFAQAVEALQSSGLDPIEHYYQYGAEEGLTPSPAVDPVDPPVGETYTLTTGIDIVRGTNLSIYGTYDAGGTSTLTPGDNIQVSGSNDVLNLTVSGSTAVDNPFAPTTVSGVETFNIQDVSTNTAAATYDFTAITGETNVNANLSTHAVSFTGLAAGTSVGVIGNGAVSNGAVSATYATGATSAVLAVTGDVVGAAGISVTNSTGITSATITTRGAVTTAGAAVGAVALAGGNTVTSATINAGSKFVSTGLSGFSTTAATTLTVNGVGAVDVGTLAATLDTVNASGNSGGLTATLNSTTAVVTGSQASDIISTGQVLTTGSVDAGAGAADQLRVTASAAVASSALGAKYANFDILGVAAGVSVDADNLSATNTLIGARYAAGGTITDMNAATAANVTAVASGTYVFGIKNATDPATNNTLIVNANDGASTTSTIAFGTPTANGVENISLTATDNLTVAALTSAADLTNLTLLGAGTQAITSGALALVPNFTVDGSAATGALTLDFSASTTRGAVFDLGSAADRLAATTSVDSITGGSGADVIIADSNIETQTITCADATGGSAGAISVVVGGVTVTTTSIATNATGAAIATAIYNALAASTALADAGYTFANGTAGVVNISSAALNGNVAAATLSGGPTATKTVATTAQGGANTAADLVYGGAGNDDFYISAGAGNTVANADTIADLDWGTSTAAADQIIVSGTGTTALYTLSSVQQTAVSNAASLAAAIDLVLGYNAANGAVTQFTYGSDTYLGINGDGGASYTETADFLVKITGATGTLTTDNIVFVS